MRNFKEKGFTLIELLVVMAIIAVLTMLGVSNFRNVQRKARDGQRKSDLAQLQRALEFYFNDQGKYPLAVDNKINSLEWKTPESLGSEFTDGTTIYIKEMVGDPLANPNYCYKSADGSSYQIYAKLENIQDPKIGDYVCGGEDYNYGVSSQNEAP